MRSRAAPPAPIRPARAADVARLAGVSPATVSRAFNTPALLDSATLERVRDAARRLEYLPYGVARSLRSRRSMVVGLLIPSLANAYFAATVERLQSLLARAGYTMLLASSNGDADAEIAATRAMLSQGIDGLVVLGRPRHEATVATARRARVPTMQSWVATAGVPAVAFDHPAAMAGVVDHLLGLGHRRFGIAIPFVAGGDLRRPRLAAIREVLSRAGVALPAQAVVDDEDPGFVGGQRALRRLRVAVPRMTALVCGNDALAAGAVMAAAADGLRVPQDLSVTGYNDLDVSSACWPTITTVRTPMPRHAERLAAALVGWMRDGVVPRTEVLETELVVRGSTGPPPRRAPGR